MLIRTYKEGDEEKILELYKAVHPERKYDKGLWMEWWRWMYKDNPAGNGKIWFAEHTGRIVGQSAIIPVVMKIGAEAVTGFQSIDTMTHPSYRRQGIYETLANKKYAEAAQDGIHIGYSFPNENSYPIAIRKLSLFDVAAMQVLLKPLNWTNTLKIRIKNKFLLKLGGTGGNLVDKIFYRAKRAPAVKGLTIAQVSSFDERINELWTRLSSQYQIMVVRNKDYLNWRYCAVPDVNYSIYIAEKGGQICGYLVLRCMQREQIEVGIIFDIFAQSEDIAQRLVSKATEHCMREKVDLIYYSAIANKAYIKAFRKNGFISVPFIKGGRFCAYSSASHISKEFLGDPKNWLVQLGDSDMI